MIPEIAERPVLPSALPPVVCPQNPAKTVSAAEFEDRNTVADRSPCCGRAALAAVDCHKVQSEHPTTASGFFRLIPCKTAGRPVIVWNGPVEEQATDESAGRAASHQRTGVWWLPPAVASHRQPAMRSTLVSGLLAAPLRLRRRVDTNLTMPRI